MDRPEQFMNPTQQRTPASYMSTAAAAASNALAAMGMHQQTVTRVQQPSIREQQKMITTIPKDSTVNIQKPVNQFYAVVSPMIDLTQTCEAYQKHIQTFVNIKKSRGDSEYFHTATILDHIVSSWIDRGGCFMHQGQLFDVEPKLFQLIMENHWNPCMNIQHEEQAQADLQIRKSVHGQLPQIGTDTNDLTMKNDKVVMLGSDSFSDDFMYHIYGYAKVHAKNIHRTMIRYRNSKRCLKHWYKNGGRLTDWNGLDLSNPEALCAMERILWQHHYDWLNEYIVI